MRLVIKDSSSSVPDPSPTSSELSKDYDANAFVFEFDYAKFFSQVCDTYGQFDFPENKITQATFPHTQ